MLLLGRIPLRFTPRALSPTRQFSTSHVFFKQLDLKDITPAKTSSTPQFKRTPTTNDAKSISKYDSIVEKLPRRFQKYGHRLIDAPLPHIVSFLTLHELSAVVPFLGLWYFFHNYGFLPTDLPSWIIVKGSGFIEKALGDSVANWSIEDRTKLIIEGATAYGIVKAFFIPRVLGSLFLTPWFARVLVEPIFGILRKVAHKIKSNKSTKN